MSDPRHRALTGAPHDAQIGLLVTIDAWQESRGILLRGGAPVLPWRLRSLCSDSAVSQHKALSYAYVKSSPHDPPSSNYPLGLHTGDPVEELGGTWWGFTHVMAEFDEDSGVSFEIFQVSASDPALAVTQLL